MIYSKKGGLTVRAYSAPPPPPHPPTPKNQKKPAANFASQGDTHVRTDAQIKFLRYPLSSNMIFILSDYNELHKKHNLSALGIAKLRVNRCGLFHM